MTTIQKRERLHLRIEQADEKIITVLDELTESLFRSFQSQTVEDTDMESAPSWAKPLTPDESLADLREGLAEYEAGEYVTLEEASNEAAKW